LSYGLLFGFIVLFQADIRRALAQLGRSSLLEPFTRMHRAAQAEAVESAPAPDTPESLMAEMRVDPLEIVLAPDLVDLVDAGSGGDLLERVRGLRRKVAMEIGVVIPPVRTRDSIDLPTSTYALRIGGVEVGRGIAPPRHALALGDDLAALPGRATTEPVFGLPGKWVPAELRHQAEMAGATVVDRSSVLITHLAEVVRQHAPRLLTREDVRALVDVLNRTNPVVVEELVPAQLTLGEVQRVLQALLEEGVAIRDLGRIFEGLSVRARTSNDLEGLVEAARAALGPALAAQYAQDGVLRVIALDPLLEQAMAEAVRPSDAGPVLALDPHRAEMVVTQVATRLGEAENAGFMPVLVCAPGLRGALRRLAMVGVPQLPVLSYSEVGTPGTRIETVGTVNGADAIAA
jgi:flagellar biosynthesis protein FlhA